MKYLLSAAALLAATVAADKRDLCSDGSTDDNNNWYCQNVTAITYTGVGGSGSYNRVTSMDSSGHCSSSPKGYSGNLSPLDEEVCMRRMSCRHELLNTVERLRVTQADGVRRSRCIFEGQ